MSLPKKKELLIGMLVDIISEQDKHFQNPPLTRGYIEAILTQGKTNKGVKVLLTSGVQGRVVHVVKKDEVRLNNFKFYNQFFYRPHLFTLWDKEKNQFFIYPHKNQLANTLELTAFLFEREDQAKQFLKEQGLDRAQISVRRLHRKKPIVDLFKKMNVTHFRINKIRKLPYDRLSDWEMKFKAI